MYAETAYSNPFDFSSIPFILLLTPIEISIFFDLQKLFKSLQKSSKSSLLYLYSNAMMQPLYSKEQFRRHEVRPGITGWAQINGRNNISWTKKFEYDVWYVDHLSLGLDLKILLLTVKKVFVREGISKEGEATTVPFDGTN